MAVPRVYVRRGTTVWSVTHSHLTSHLLTHGRTNIDFFIPLHNRPQSGNYVSLYFVIMVNLCKFHSLRLQLNGKPLIKSRQRVTELQLFYEKDHQTINSIHGSAARMCQCIHPQKIMDCMPW